MATKAHIVTAQANKHYNIAPCPTGGFTIHFVAGGDHLHVGWEPTMSDAADLVNIDAGLYTEWDVPHTCGSK